jgi:hypothetical protein
MKLPGSDLFFCGQLRPVSRSLPPHSSKFLPAYLTALDAVQVTQFHCDLQYLCRLG